MRAIWSRQTVRAGRWGERAKAAYLRGGAGGVLRFFEREQERAAALVILVDAQCKGGDGRTTAYSRRAQSRAAEGGEGARGGVDVGDGG